MHAVEFKASGAVSWQAIRQELNSDISDFARFEAAAVYSKMAFSIISGSFKRDLELLSMGLG